MNKYIKTIMIFFPILLWAEESMYRKMYTEPPRVDLQNSTNKPIYFTFGTEKNPPMLRNLTNLGAKPPRVHLYPHYSLSGQDLGATHTSEIIMLLSDKPNPTSAKEVQRYVFTAGKPVYIAVSRNKYGTLDIGPQHKPGQRARKIVHGNGKRVHVRKNVTKRDIQQIKPGEIL